VAGFACLAVACCGAVPAWAASDTTPIVRSHAVKKPIALSPWEQAERGRDALEATPEHDRTRADYTRAMDAYRAIYHANPADIHAPAAVNAVAELLTELGRGQGGPKGDAKSLKAAVGQYEFLRTQYPGSSLRVQALLAEGQIEENDLGDAAAAKQKYTLLLKQYPRSEQADEAKAGLESLQQLSVVSSQLSGKAAARKTTLAPSVGAVMEHSGSTRSLPRGTSARNDDSGVVADQSQSIQKPAVSGQRSAAGQGSSLPAMPLTSGANPMNAATQNTGVAQPTLHDEAMAVQDGPPVSGLNTAVADSAAKRGGKRALVTGIRHWSTATYTRVAIDLGDNVTYEAARVPNPDRIYFDLHGAKLAQELVGKSFAVTDDGFLKKVRAAQYSDDVTRVVLDVNDVTEYSAFLLPNPYRLIIDIHGGKMAAAMPGTANSEAAPVVVPAPRVAPVVKATEARPVPNAVATRSTNAASEVADLSQLPGRVDATSKPTSKPISAVVETENREQGTGNIGDVGTDAVAAPGAAVQNGSSRGTAGATGGVPDTAAGVPSSMATDSSKKTKKSRSKPASSSNEVADATPARAAVRTADGETSLVRALGLKIGRIVIDAGHGGHDSGTIGVDGIEEKDVVLDVALRLGKLLHDRLGTEVIYTRSDDTFIPLETRTAIANKAQADLFLSIHANSSPEESARGVETYYLNFTSDPTALDVAARENAVSDQSIHQLSDLVKKIALKDKIEESREFAADVEGSLYTGLAKGNVGLKDRGVKKAPFVVLIGANMPSILAEISFVTNSKDAEQLAQPEYRQRVAESLYKGVARYEGGLSGTKPPTERAAAGQ
jgi:N-acetylmuramoyl-L-alanine amidase